MKKLIIFLFQAGFITLTLYFCKHDLLLPGALTMAVYGLVCYYEGLTEIK